MDANSTSVLRVSGRFEGLGSSLHSRGWRIYEGGGGVKGFFLVAIVEFQVEGPVRCRGGRKVGIPRYLRDFQAREKTTREFCSIVR